MGFNPVESCGMISQVKKFYCKKNKDTLDKTMFQRFITHRMHVSQLSGVSL